MAIQPLVRFYTVALEDREKQFLREIASGKSVIEAGEKIGIAKTEAYGMRGSIKRMLNVDNELQLGMRIVEMNLLKDHPHS